MKRFIVMITSVALMAASSVHAEDKSSKKDRSYGDSRYQLEKNYPSPERRYSRAELDRARRRANNSLWMKQYGYKDPIYQSDQYLGRSRKGRSYGKNNYNKSRYKLEKKYPSPERRYSRKELDRARRRANNSLWMKQYGKKDPIYRSDQYRGRSSGNYRRQYGSKRY